MPCKQWQAHFYQLYLSKSQMIAALLSLRELRDADQPFGWDTTLGILSNPFQALPSAPASPLLLPRRPARSWRRRKRFAGPSPRRSARNWPKVTSLPPFSTRKRRRRIAGTRSRRSRTIRRKRRAPPTTRTFRTSVPSSTWSRRPPSPSTTVQTVTVNLTTPFEEYLKKTYQIHWSLLNTN